MPTDSPSHGRRPFHRGRRGHDRRGQDRRSPQQLQEQQQTPEQGPRGDHVDVERIMRDIRARIAQRSGIELTEQQVQELAARRLESILDPRTIKPSLLDQLRRSAGMKPDTAAADRAEAPYTFDDTTLYDSHRGLTRLVRKLLNPILKLFLDPNPLIRALHVQSRLNREWLQREAERDRRQTEWNALHYEILHRLVTEVSRVSLEVQSLALRVESLAAKVDFNERRVRGIEGSMHQGRPASRDAAPATAVLPATASGAPPAPQAESAAAEPATGEAPRRRRRRRRGRRGGGGVSEIVAPGQPETPPGSEAEGEEIDEAGAFEAAEAGIVESETTAETSAPPLAVEESPIETPVARHEPEHASPVEAPIPPEEPTPERDPTEQ